MKAKYIIYSFAAILLLGTSCKKFLDQTPISEPTDGTTWKSDGDANAGVAAIYALIRAAYNSDIGYYAYGDLPSGEFTSSDDGSYQNALSINWGVGVPPENTYDPMIKLRVYTDYYTAIAQSNRALSFLSAMPVSAFTGDDAASQQVRKNKYLGEAYFTRAFMYFNMCRIWGDVPLVLENTDGTVSQQYTRTPQATVLKQVIADLNIAIKDMNWRDNSSQDRVVRADRGAAYALLAHVYAWMGNYDDCNSACDQVINSGSYTLEPASNFTDIYKGQSQEGIFEIAQNSVSEGTVANIRYTLAGATLTAPYLPTITVPLWHINNSLVTTLYSDTNDVRFKKGFIQISSGGASFYECIKYINLQELNNNPQYEVSMNNIIIFRLADIELLKAEALCAKSAPDFNSALSIVNSIRSNRNAAAITQSNDILQTVIDERGRELFLEGHRFYDLVRLERINHVQQFDEINPGEFTNGKYYWPIDPGLFLTNSKLNQTPFWTGKVN